VVQFGDLAEVQVAELEQFSGRDGVEPAFSSARLEDI
jgi:hypothetical protein